MPRCKHYDICGLLDEADPKARLCILHSKKVDKDPQAFAEALARHRQTKGNRFAYMAFPEMVDFFMSDTSPIAVDFSYATCSQIGFSTNTTFSEAKFEETTFSAEADFSSATFSEQANFSGATFSAGAFFTDAIFSAEADFSSATFSKEANFHIAVFSKEADFSFANFSEEVGFNGATFSAEAKFEWVKFSSGADFQTTQFTGGVSFLASHFMGRTIFAFEPPALGQGEEPQHEEPSGPLFARAQEVDFREVFIVPPDALIIQHADLQRCRFLDTDLRKIEITGVIWPRRGHRLVVYDEIAPIPEDPYPWDQLERLYRELKQNYEDRRNYPRAGDFHYGEKEMQRRNPRTPLSLKVFLWLYWVVSGYGERFLRPLLWAVGLLVLGTGAYLWWGLLPKSSGVTVAPAMTEFFVFRVIPDRPPPLAITKVSDWLSALHYSLRVMTLLRPDDLVPVGAAKVVYTLQSLLGPLFLGLFVLAVRQRLKH